MKRPTLLLMDWRNQPKSFWQNKLSDQEYNVTREGGTERAFSGRYWAKKDPGEYVCVCCETPLFDSDSKYDSGSGWPSFFKSKEAQPEQLIERKEDHSHSMVRTEIVCKTCGAHLGHLFDDGPKPTGQRFCVNSASLKFKDKK